MIVFPLVLPVVFVYILVTPFILFNQSGVVDVSFLSSVSNISLFFNTLQSNKIIFQLSSSSKKIRFNLDLTSKNRSLSKIIDALANSRFHLITIDNQSQSREYQLDNEQIFNDGYPHQIRLNLNNNRLIIDGIHNESLSKYE